MNVQHLKYPRQLINYILIGISITNLKYILNQSDNLISFALYKNHLFSDFSFIVFKFFYILNYLQTGDYEDFGIFPSDITKTIEDTQTTCLKELIEQKCNIARIPFLRETEAYIRLRGLFRFGKLYFSIKRSDEFIDYLNSKGL